MYLQTSDLYTVIYQEIIDEITRTDTTIPTTAISMAIDEAKGYLSEYDLLQLFGDDTASPPVDPTVTNAWLQNLVKDIAAWQLIKLANPNVSYEHIRRCYEDAIDTLKRIKTRVITPQGWPLYVPPPGAQPPGSPIIWSSGPRRHNHF